MVVRQNLLIGLAIAPHAVTLERSKSEEVQATKVAIVMSSLNSYPRRQHGYRVKPHGQLVPVSLTHYCASTPDLSTSWSWTTLQGDQVPGKISSSGKFPA